MAMQNQGEMKEMKKRKYEEESGRLMEQIQRAESLACSLSQMLNPCPVPEPQNSGNTCQYNGTSVIGFIERMTDRLTRTNDDLQNLLEVTRKYLGQDVGIIG